MRSAALFFVLAPSASCSAFTESSSDSAHLSSSHRVPVAVASACWAAVTTADTRSASTPVGSIDHPLNPLQFAIGAGATFIARATDTDAKTLAAILERAYGRVVQLNTVTDPHVLGGLRVQVGAEVVDATVLSRLADARRRLAS